MAISDTSCGKLCNIMSLLVATTFLSIIFLRCKSQLTETPNVVVSQDGTGDFRTIAGAMLAAPNHSIDAYHIKIKQGIYREYIQINKKKINIVFIGEGMDSTVITGNRSFIDGNKTYDTATVRVFGNGFTAQDISFRNDAGLIKHQAVALMVEADYVSFYRCRFDGYQDTLYTNGYRQFYRDCKIYGTIDFICGDATALFQNCIIKLRTPLGGQYNTITAQRREVDHTSTGIVLQNCTVKAKQDMNNVITYFGRSWGKFSRTVIMESYVDNLINPRGWIEWSTNKSDIRHPYYLEYKNRGPGAITEGRVTWAFVTTDPNIASNFTVRHFINGDKWISANIPHYLDFS